MKKAITRRQFLQGTAAERGGRTRLYSSAPRGAQVLGANERINIGVIGCGGMGTAHLRDLMTRLGDAKNNLAVVGVSDIYEPRKNNAKALSGAELCHDYRKMLERRDLTAVVIATRITGTRRWRWTPWTRAGRVSAEADDLHLGRGEAGREGMPREGPRASGGRRAVVLGRPLVEGGRVDPQGRSRQAAVEPERILANSTGGEWNYGIDEGAPGQSGLERVSRERAEAAVRQERVLPLAQVTGLFRRDCDRPVLSRAFAPADRARARVPRRWCRAAHLRAEGPRGAGHVLYDD